MKKFLFAFFSLFICATSAQAAFDIGGTGGVTLKCAAIPPAACSAGAAGTGCNIGSDYCNGCVDTTTSTPQTGIKATTSYKQAVYCAGSASYNCRCEATTTYTCASGYCGSCTDETDIDTCTCTQIPTGGICNTDGTTGCQEGYYKNVSLNGPATCTACPANSVSCTSATDFTCKKNYYKTRDTSNQLIAKDKCEACPDNSVTDTAGATSVAECYIPSGTTFSDASGNGKFVTDCYSD